jgi:hypothetical protein
MDADVGLVRSTRMLPTQGQRSVSLLVTVFGMGVLMTALWCRRVPSAGDGAEATRHDEVAHAPPAMHMHTIHFFEGGLASWGPSHVESTVDLDRGRISSQQDDTSRDVALTSEQVARLSELAARICATPQRKEDCTDSLLKVDIHGDGCELSYVTSCAVEGSDIATLSELMYRIPGWDVSPGQHTGGFTGH